MMSPDRIVHQKIIARIDPVSRLSSGTSEISLSCTKKDLDRLSLNCRHLIIKSISINGAPIDYTLDELTLDRLVEDELPTNYTGEPVQYPNRLRQALLNGRDKKELTIVLPQPTPENILLRIEYEFEGNFVIKERDDGELKYFQVHQAGMDGMGRHWMPCFEDDNIPWDLEYRISSKGIPANLIQSIHVASSGALCQQFQLADEHESVFQFKLDLPSPPKHISFATGLFDMLRIPAAPFASAFCPLGMASKLSLAVEFLSRTFGFTNWYLGTSFPYPSYYCVFLREVLTAGEPLSSANVSLFSTLDLYNSTIIDQNLIMRNLLCTALAEQYFGIRLQPEGIDSRWLTVGIAGFLTRHMLRIFHGNNDFRYNIKKDMTTLLAMDAGHGAVSEAPEIFANPLDEDWLRLKSYLIIMIFEHRMEKGVIQKIISHVWGEFVAGRLPGNVLGTATFLKLTKKVSGKDMRTFSDQWIYSAGCPVFNCSFSFNRKRSTIEVDLKQSIMNQPQRKVSGTLLIRVHEVDGVFDHSVHIDDFTHHFELPVHAKAKKIKKKKRLMTPNSLETNHSPVAKDGKEATEEEDEGFVSPLSWIRLDPEMEWIASLELHQPEFMLTEQLQNDRDVIAQHEAIEALRRQPSDAVIESFERILNDPKCFYRVRIEAAEGLSACAPNPETHLGGLKLISFYNKGFALQSLETVVVPIPKTNNFEALQSYYIQSSLAGAMAKIRTKNGTLMELVGQVLLNMMRFNDNAGNMYSDNYYVSALIAAMMEHLRARRTLDLPIERLSREFVRELDRYAIVERIQPYYQNTVMTAIIEAWRDLRKIGIAPSTAITSSEMLIRDGNSIMVRLSALEYFLTNDEVLKDSVVEAMKNLLSNQNNGVKTATINMLARLSSKMITCRGDLNSKRISLLWECLNIKDVTLSCRLLYFISKIVDVAASDRPVEVGRIALRIALPTTHELSSEGEATGAQGADEPDWFLEVSEGHRPISRPKSTSAMPKLRVSLNDNSLESKLKIVVQGIWNNFDSFPFRYPVDPSVVGYYDIIKSPIDLSTIQARLDSGKLSTLTQLCEALRLMFDNCFAFNVPESLIFEQAKRLCQVSYKELKRAFPEHSKEIRSILMTKKSTIVIPHIVPNFPPPPPPPKKTAKLELTLGERMEKVLDKTRAHPYAFWFFSPVDPVALNIPTYTEIITEPMDLGTLEGRFRAGEFDDNPREFHRLLDLIFTNCITFNPTNTIVHQNALKMREATQKLIKRFLPEASMDTKEAAVPKLKIVLSPKKTITTTPLKLKISLPQRDLSWYPSANRVLEQVCAHECANPFLTPVDPITLNIPSYPKIIKNPMDLSTIRDKLSSQAYQTLADMNRDYRLMFANCYKFNGKGAPISEAAKVLESFYDSLYLRMQGNMEE